MLNVMSYWGPDGSGSWRNGSVGLGHLMLYNSQQSPHETLPLNNEADGFVITANARLDNRDFLFQALRIAPPEQIITTDSVLILKAYQKWGSECTQHLLGDWCFALWDAQNHTLFLARDQFGVTSFYYTQIGQSFIFASSLKGILALPEISHRLNKRVIACFAPGYLHDTATPYQNIFRLAPAHTLTVTKSHTKLQRYWSMEDTRDIRYRSDQEYIDHFMDTYRQAVNCRLRSFRPVGAQLSGGLDSSSIAILAAQKLAQLGKRLPAFSSAPLYDINGLVPDGRCGDESPYVNMIAEMSNHIDVNFVTAKNISPLAGIKYFIDILEQPIGAASNAYWIIALLQTAQQKKIGTLLSGWGGNYTVSWTGDRREYLRHLIKNKHLSAYLHEAYTWRKSNSETLWHAIRSQVLKPLIPFSWVNKHNMRKTTQLTPFNMSQVKTLASNYERDEVFCNSALSGLNLYFQNGIVGSHEEELGAAFGLEIRQPTMDKRLIEFCLGIPQDQYTRNGQNKLLIRRAMHNLLPKQVLWSKHRGLQAADIGQRIRFSTDEIEETMKTLEASDLVSEFLNLEKMNDFYLSVQKGLNQSSPVQMSFLLRGIMLGIFLQRFDDK